MIFLLLCSGSQKSLSPFALQDIDCMLTEASSAKKETSSKPRVPFLRSKIPPSNKKRKESDLVGSEAFPILLEFKEAVRHSQMGIEQMSRSYSEKLSENEDLKKLDALRLKKADEDAAKIAKLEEEIKIQAQKHESFLEELGKRHDKQMDELMEGAKRNAGAVILEARIKMAEEVGEKGFDTSLWDVESWKKAKAKFSLEGSDDKNEEEVERVEEDMVLEVGNEVSEPVAQ